VAVDVTPVFATYFARNRGPVPGDPDSLQSPDYGVIASLEGSAIDLTLTFRASSAYCCYEWGCHLNLHEGKQWELLRRELSACSLVLVERLELRLAVVVEPEALFFDCSRPDPKRRGWYAFASGEAFQYKVVVCEG
jgi:hypothetical protein